MDTSRASAATLITGWHFLLDHPTAIVRAGTLLHLLVMAHLRVQGRACCRTETELSRASLVRTGLHRGGRLPRVERV